MTNEELKQLIAVKLYGVGSIQTITNSGSAATFFLFGMSFEFTIRHDGIRVFSMDVEQDQQTAGAAYILEILINS